MTIIYASFTASIEIDSEAIAQFCRLGGKGEARREGCYFTIMNTVKIAKHQIQGIELN